MRRVLARACLVMVGLLAVGVVSTRTASAQSTPFIWFSDDFSAGTLNKWLVSPLGLASNWSAAGGTAAYNGGGHTQLYTGSMTWADYTVETKFQLDNGSNYPGGLRGRLDTTTGQSYAAWIYPSQDVIKLYRATAWHIDTAGLTELGEASVGTIAPGTFHTLSLTFSGSQITVTFNGTAIITVSDSVLTSGGIALDVSNQPIQFDDVRVFANAPPPPVTLFTEDFSSATLANWTPSPLGLFSNWSAAANDAAYNGGGHTQIYAGSDAWTDYTFTTKIRLANGSNYPGGIRGRVNTSTGVGYAAWLYPGSSLIKLFRTTAWNIDTSGLTELAEAPVTITAGEFHTVALTFAGSSIQVQFDGASIISTSDTSAAALTGGAIALDVSNQPIEYDDVTVVGTPPANDSTPPTVSISSPSSGATVAGSTVSIAASATDDVSVSSVRFTVDGVAIGSPDTTSPYSIIWDSTSVADGSHTLAAIARDPRGNESTATVAVTVNNAALTQGPGGPILILSTPADPFSRYYGEILLAEGLNQYRIQDISTVDATVLAGYDVVLLASQTLSATQVSMLTDWVNGGGNLIAMRPDAQLAGLLGLTASGGTLSNAYLGIDTTSSGSPGVGITSQTMQFHGAADLYTLTGGGSAGAATAVATLFSDATTPTSAANPAVTLRNVGTVGGQAAAFTYDLARSVVWTRQGNPAWSGQERDGVSPIRSDDLFFGASSSDPQPDWVDLNKVAIPQADEQQRLLVNLMEAMNRDRKPLPRFWYLPRGNKAAIVMTGDDHGNNGTTGRFQGYEALSPAGCSVDNWECVRGTSYIYPSTPITPSQAAAFDAEGFEIGVHVTTNCADWTPTTLPGFYSNDLTAFAALFSALPAPVTNRTHCIAWSDYVTQAKVELSNGIRFDTNYYYWPGSWIQDKPGLFTGSGFPMRFADVDGKLIDVYQAVSQMTDESDQTFPFTIDSLLDKALGPEGYYAVLTANMHTDSATSSGSDAIVNAALTRGVPIVAARQMLHWLDGRNASNFANITKTGTTLTFTINAAPGSNGLQALLPTASATGTLTALTKDGTAVSFATQTIKGTSYAIFTAQPGAYQATYSAP